MSNEVQPTAQSWAPGFYDDGSGVERWWDGEGWTVHAKPGTTQTLLQFTSHIQGRNATVRVFEDRVEWERPRTLLRGTAATEMVPMKAVSSVTTQRNGLLNTLVHLTVSGNRLSFNADHTFAERAREILNGLILGTSQRLAGAVQPDLNSRPAAGAPGLLDQIQQLAALQQQGLLTDEEFAAAKRQLLGL